MAAIGVRTELKRGYQYDRRTGLIFRTYDGAGNLVDSNDKVPIADSSTAVLGKANPNSANARLNMPVASNSRQDATGV